MAKTVNIKNRKAGFEYEIIQKYTAGMQLVGTEIKSIRDNQASIAEAHCVFIRDELWVKNLHIAEYSHGGYSNHKPKRERKLLLTAQELNKLSKKLNDKGLTIIPTRLFISDRGFAKLEIAVAKGKKLHDKRESLKKKDVQREINRAMKE